MALEIRQLHPLFVAEVHGVALDRLDDETRMSLGEAIDRYSVLVFHGQSLDDDQLLALGHRFGSIAAPRNHRVERRLKHAEIADVSNLDAKNDFRGRADHRRLDALGNQLWHSDASFRPISGELSMLFAHIVPPKGGDTEFADLRAAYDDLDTETKLSIDGLTAVHSIFHSRGQLGHTEYTEAERQSLPDVHHPIVRTHPGSGRKTLYLGAHASHVVGWPMPEGRLLIRDLMERATRERFTYAHRWQVGDLVIWDNRCTLHRGRPYADDRYKRDLRRVTTQDLTSIDDNPELVRELGLLPA
ncbi:MAG: TauD/TfdA dioxygenase family protein [Hyphomicrobiaceae bacterium]